MSLTWKDAVATILVGAVGLVAYAKFKGFDWPLLSSWRTAILALLVVGLASCIVIGSDAVLHKNAWITLSSGLGILAFILVAAGLLLGSEVVFYALVANIFLLWFITTLHHLVVKET